MADGDFINRNICKNATQTAVATTADHTGALADMKCSEVVMSCTAATMIYDGNANFEVPANTIMSFRGLTNANQLTAHNTAGSGEVYYRAQYYTMSLQNG